MALKKLEFTPESGSVDTYDTHMWSDSFNFLEGVKTKYSETSHSEHP